MKKTIESKEAKMRVRYKKREEEANVSVGGRRKSRYRLEKFHAQRMKKPEKTVQFGCIRA